MDIYMYILMFIYTSRIETVAYYESTNSIFTSVFYKVF